MKFGLTALTFPRRKNIIRRIDGTFNTEKDLHYTGILRSLGYNKQEVAFLATNPWGELKKPYLEPYYSKFKDEYQPFGNGLDELDAIPISEIYRKEGASVASLARLGGKYSSALFEFSMSAILSIRGVPEYPTDIYRLQGDNQMLHNALAKRLGTRVWRNRSIFCLLNKQDIVVITYKLN